MQGPAGAQGPPGPQGAQGPQGAPGAPGAFAGQISMKTGNNGTVSCATYCAGAAWGPTGTCVGAKLIAGSSAGSYVDCQTMLGVGNDLSCWCSQF
jgi:hypothetical protein